MCHWRLCAKRRREGGPQRTTKWDRFDADLDAVKAEIKKLAESAGARRAYEERA